MSSSSVVTSLLLVTLFLLSTPTVDSASLRDYVNSAAHYVGMDSLVSVQEEVTTALPESADASAPLPRCCDLPQSPCGVEKVVVPVTPCPQVKKPLPPCSPCAIDYSQANAKSHAKMWEVVVKGKALASTLTHALAAPVVFTNDQISAAASLLPGALAAQGRIIGAILSAPVHFAAGKSSLIAKGVSGVVVGVPVAIGTGVAAGVSGLMERGTDIARQQECLCDQQQSKSKAKQEDCPHSCHTPLLAAGSKNEEQFTIDDPVTDSDLTDAIGGNQADSQESVTDSTFTTTDGSAVMTLSQSEEGVMMGMPDRMQDI